MNIFAYEIKTQLKNFITWAVSILLIFIVLNSIFDMFIGSKDAVQSMVENLPSAFSAAFGLVMTEIFTYSGFYGFIYTYIALIGAIMAASIALSVFSREKNAKCVDFLLTKPVSRSRVFALKLLVCLAFIVALNILYIATVSIAYASAGLASAGMGSFIWASCALLFTQIVFMSFGILFAVFARKVRSVSGVATAIGFAAFILKVLQELLDKEAIRFISPINYFDTHSVFAMGGFEAKYVVTAAVVVIACAGLSYFRYVKTDVPAVQGRYQDMNILKKELRAGFKTFIFWCIGIFVLVYLGIVKYDGLTGGNINMTEILSQFPRVVLAILGLAGVDPNTLGGYTAILTYYALICAVIYAVHLGSNAVSRESIDKTYEFIFTKPCSRSRILAMKLLAAWIYLAVLSALYALFAIGAVASINVTENINAMTALFAVSVFLIGSLFIALSAFLSAALKRTEKGSMWGNLAFLYAFIVGIIYDMLEKGGALRLIAPFKYFLPGDIIDGRLSAGYAILTVGLTAVLLFFAFNRFRKKDLLQHPVLAAQ